MAMLETQISRGIARVSLNRPDVHNAFNSDMIEALTTTFTTLSYDEAVRVVVLSGNGQSFCAGADLDWMRRASTYSETENARDALNLAHMLRVVNACWKPVIGHIHGAALGGGLGLVACCDAVVANEATKFGLTEVRLGLIPATIAPFVIAKIGVSAARRYMLAGDRFGAQEALRVGLIHAVTEEADTQIQSWIDAYLASAPGAIADTKRLISEVAQAQIDDDLLYMTALRIAARRASDEGREGMAAFLDKRKPNWMGDVQ